MAGLELTGFLPKTLDELITELEDEFRAQFGENIRVDAQSVNGQIIGVFAALLTELWEELENVYSSAYIGGATGAALDDLVALAGLSRVAATASETGLELTGTALTVVPAGSLVQDSSTGTNWATLTQVILTGGTDSVQAQAVVTGPIRANAGTIDTIVNPISGWDTVTNPLDVQQADLGQDDESDASLRERFRLGFFLVMAGTVEAIRASVLRLTGVSTVNIFENTTDTTDANGLPPHSFEVIVQGGVDQDIVDTIGITKPAGIQTFGSSSGIYVDALGNPQTINFSRPVTKEIYFEVDYTPIPFQTEPDVEQQIIDAIVDHGESLSVGDDVVPFQFIQAIEAAGLSNLVIRIGLDAINVFNQTIFISSRELALVDSSRIVIQEV